MRKVLVKMLEPYDDIEVVATAMDGVFALEKLERVKPDVVTLDLEMPRMDGRTALQRIVDDFQLPVILVSAHTSKGARATFEGLAAGAVDFVTKPARIFTTPLDSLSSDLAQKIRRRPRPESEGRRFAPSSRCAPRRKRRRRRKSSPSRSPPAAPTPFAAPLPDPGRLPPGFSIVQHMPEGFTGQFADRLSKLASIGVREAEDGDVVASGVAFVAPGRHMEIVRARENSWCASLSRRLRGHRPSADVLSIGGEERGRAPWA
jgi:two-component system chemotaxis response regulator CheB